MKPQNKATIERLTNGDTLQREQGAILLIVLVLIFAVTLAVMAYLYLNKNNTLIASNLAVQNAAQEATDVGLQNASQLLQSTSIELAAPKYYFPSISAVPSNYGVPSGASNIVPPQASFWQGCAAAGTCAQLPSPLKFGPYSFQIQYIIFASPALPVPLSGYQVSGGAAPTAIYYVVFVHAQKTGGGGLGVTAQAIIRKVS